MKTLDDGFMGALALYHLERAPSPLHVERADQILELIRAKDERPAYVAELVAAHHDASTSYSVTMPAGGFSYTIGGELLTVPQETLDKIAAAKTVTLRIDSPGGDCDAAWRLLESLEGKPVTVTVAYAASAAALLAACVPGHRTIEAGGSMMIHPLAGFYFGNAASQRRFADWIEELTQRWITRLVARTGQDWATVEGWLSGGDLRFTPAQALAFNLVDEIQ